MHFSTFAVWAAAAFSAAMAYPASTAPEAVRPRDSWTNYTVNANGNLNVLFSDETIKLGTAPVSVIMGNLTKLCSSAGLCDTSGYQITGYQLIDAGVGGQISSEVITLTPGSAPFNGTILNQLLSAMGNVINATANCTQVSETSPCSELVSPEGGCDQTTTTATECVVPRYWGIDYQIPGQAVGSSMSANLAVSYPTQPGFCSIMTTLTTGLTSAVNGVAGGLFSLAALACL